uniref:Immunoglobulin-like and fibronectin type III domain-containing protein 1 n=1 Tax=Gouania willdenowi TaxID=441366 RepID=A0A8C5I2V1_GOUWI
MWRKKSMGKIRSKISGVMITQYLVNVPEGKSSPDFLCKPTAVTVNEGDLAVFKAVVLGNPKPEVTWKRNTRCISKDERFQSKYEESSGDHLLEIHNVSAADVDIYKCCIANDYGKAFCSASLNVTQGKLGDTLLFPYTTYFMSDMFSAAEIADAEGGDIFWEAMLNADRNDYMRICSEFGVADVELILKKLDDKKKLKGIDRSMVRKCPSNVDFVIKVQEISATEGDDALFECVLTHPLPKITWTCKGKALEDAEKYNVTVSDHKLIHRLLIKGCTQLDVGIYSAVAGSASCSAWLLVEGNRLGSKKLPRKTTVATRASIDLEKVAREQQMKNREELGRILASLCDMTCRFMYGFTPTCVFQAVHSCFRRSADPGVHFISGLSDVNAIINESAELICKLSSDDCDGVWFRDGKKISPDDNFSITQDGPTHKLVINKCLDEHSGKYRFEADGRKTEARLNVKDPPRINLEDLDALSKPLTIKTGNHAVFKVCFVGYKPMKIQWYREGEELQDDANVKIELSANHSRLLLSRCQRKDMGEIKIKLKNEHGFTEAVSTLIVLDKPSSPLGPAEVTESSATCIEFKWRPPKDDGGCPVINYIMERQQVGRNTWKKLGVIPGVPIYRDIDVEHGRKYCYRLRAVTTEGTSDPMETDKMQAGTLAFPGPPAPPKVVSAFDDCINISWTAPSNTGRSRILGYKLEKRKKGSNLWNVVNGLDELIKEKKYAVKDVVAGMEYEFRVTAINLSGQGEFSNPSEFVFARDPKMRPKFTSKKMKSFMVVRAGNTVQITVNFEASPRPQILWLKDNVPVAKRVTISNSDESTQLLIPSSERSDSGIYSVVVKNLVGQETFSTEVRVTDDPKPPGPVELEENVPGTVTVIWQPSPDEKRDDRLYYIVSKLDSTMGTWAIVADRLFNNKFTVCNIMHGREYHFRVYARNDMGMSAPSESPTWGCNRVEHYGSCPPTFIVPLKLHALPKGYECSLSCAVKGNPTPRITWYRNHISINTNTNYYISNTCGVCSMLILRVGPKDTGEYSVTAENSLGRAESSTILTLKDLK